MADETDGEKAGDGEEGRAKGGRERAKRLSPEERKEIAKKAAKARWHDSVPQAICGAPDHPLRIGGCEIPCYVLEGGERVITQAGMLTALGLSWGRGPERLAAFASQDRVKPFLDKKLLDRIVSPIRFIPTSGGRALGYEAEVLADLCEAVLAARADGRLQKQQMHIATRCEVLLRGFARVGIVALIDEATGYQKVRASRDLAKILEKFVAKELQPYISTFPSDFYQEMFRLRGLEFPRDSVRRPLYFAGLTTDVVYKRLAPGVLKKLKEVTPRSSSGRHKKKLFQSLTQDYGYLKLRELLSSVVTIMKLSKDWRHFADLLDRLHPRFGDTLKLDFGEGHYDYKEDNGQGL